MKTLKITLLALLATFLLSGCDILELSGRNGIYVDKVKVVQLQSAFTGGGCADPNKGFSYRCHLYSANYSEYPGKETPEIYIGGFRYNKKEYESSRAIIEIICINNLASVGNLQIMMNQGKYEGGNEYVSSVSIDEYFEGEFDAEGKQQKNARFSIIIVLKDNRRIHIRYAGKIYPDGMV